MSDDELEEWERVRPSELVELVRQRVLAKRAESEAAGLPDVERAERREREASALSVAYVVDSVEVDRATFARELEARRRGELADVFAAMRRARSCR